MSARTLADRVTRLALLAVPLLLVACGGGAATTTATTTGTPGKATPVARVPTVIKGSIAATATPIPPGPPPSPATVDYGTVTLIPDWQGLGIPQYPGSHKVAFTAASGSSVQNAGTMLFQTPDSPAKVLAYYRGALPLSGFKEEKANSLQLVESSTKASVTVNAVKAKTTTDVIIVVTDPLG